MARLCDQCEKREGTLKCNICRQVYCKKCPSLYLSIVSVIVTMGGSFMFAGFKMPMLCISCDQDDKNLLQKKYLVRF